MADSTTSTARDAGPSTATRVGAGVLGGGVTYLLGYALTYLLTSDPIRRSFAGRLVELVTGEPATWKMVGWVFYSAHFAETVIPGVFGGSRTVNLVDALDAVPGVVYLVPPVLLVVAGAALAWWADASDVREGATAGAAVAVGYFPLAVVGAFLFTIAVGDAVARPDLIPAAVVAGVAYPVVFGAVGGVVGAAATGRERSSRPSE